MKKLVYIGNNLKKGNPTSIVLLSKILKQNFIVVSLSNKRNKIIRLSDMIIGFLINKDSDYLLIDTYSTLNFYYAVIISQLSRVLNIPYVIILRGGSLPSRLKSTPFLCDLIFLNSYVNVALSGYMEVEFKKNKYKTLFIPNAIELKNYVFKSRNKLHPRLLWVRAFQDIYNPIMAIQVLYILKKIYPTASLCMVGPDKDGSLEQAERAAKKNGIQDAIEFTGLLDKKSWIEKSKEFDIFINTTTVDNTPVSILEAMALGLPVVSTNVGGIPYLINNEVTGVLVENNNELAMANAIVKLIESPIETKIMTKNARTLVEGFDVAIVKQQWYKLLSE